MLLKITIILTLLALFIQYIEGFERAIVVAESDVTIDEEDNTIARAVRSDPIYIFENSCCINGNCSCPSLYNALANLTSNFIINITSDVNLFSIISLFDLANITITGHKNPTVNCNNSGGLQFMSCSNCTINGITWKQCGARNISADDGKSYPVLQLSNSSNITIQNCSFLHSKGQAVVLSGISEDVNINFCNFLHNKEYKGHGIAIHYLSSNKLMDVPFKFKINGCNFYYNERAKSLVYFDQSSTKLCGYLNLQNSKFHGNKGVPIYLSNQDIYINGNLEFSNNIAENGGGIVISDHSNVIFHKNAEVSFTNNTATNNGGAIFLNNHSSVLFTADHFSSYHCYENNTLAIDNQYQANLFAIVKFCNNKAYGFGQDIYANNSIITIDNNVIVRVDGSDNELSFFNSSAVYTEHYSAITFKGNSKVTFNENIAINGGAVYSGDHSTITFEGNSTVTFTENNARRFGGALYSDYSSNITFKGNSTVAFNNNTADDNGGGLYSYGYATITFEENSTVTFNNNAADNNGGAVYSVRCTAITFEENTTVTFNNNTANDHSGGAVYSYGYTIITFEGNSTVTFNNNTADDNGAAMHSDRSSFITFKENSTVTFNDNKADDNGGAMCSYLWSALIFEGNSTVIFNDNTADANGGAVYSGATSTIIIFGENSSVKFNNNEASSNGGGVCSYKASTIIFEGKSTVIFNNNRAGNGGALYNHLLSTMTFEGNSTIVFINNIAANGGAVHSNENSTIAFKGRSTGTFTNYKAQSNCGAVYSHKHSTITFEGNPTVTFNQNKAIDGGALYSDDHSTITFEGNSTVTFNNNKAFSSGGAVYSYNYSTITFKGDPTVTCDENRATDGGAFYSDHHSTIRFQGNSVVILNHNRAFHNGGTVYSHEYSTVTFEGSSTVTFNSNGADDNGGAVHGDYSSTITFEGNSVVIFNNNGAGNGGAVYSDHSSITLEGNSIVTFSSNKARGNGGAVYSYEYSTITFKGNSTVKFNNNSVNSNGGAVYSDYSSITLEGNSTVTFNNDRAHGNGGAVHSYKYSTITFKGNSIVIFNNITAGSNGGAVYSDNSFIMFGGNSIVKFNNNIAGSNGGAVYGDKSVITFQGNSAVTFINNKADNNGGAFYTDKNSTTGYVENCIVMFNSNTADNNGGAIFAKRNTNVTFIGKSMVTFYNNTANNNGGAFYADRNSAVKYIENSTIVFNSNTAILGGSVFIKSSSIIIKGNSFVNFINNAALKDGGAIYLSDRFSFSLFNNSTVTFFNNTASDYGPVVYASLKESSINFNSSEIYFKDNLAGTIQKSVYMNVPKLCDSSCLYHSVSIVNEKNFPFVASPNRLKLYHPAKCINGNDTSCDVYYMNNIMLGQEFTFDACLLDYYDHPTKAAEFLITGMNHQDYNISSSKYISISCNHTTQSLSVIGNLYSNNSYNYSMTISLYVNRLSESKIIAVNVTVELSQCHPGFWYSSGSQKCVCYETENIISCSGSNSTIKRGYWFGSLNGKSTVTSCPNDYCNFTCCEVTSGIYHLSPVRANQCRPHRSGTACGNCEIGYTLSFDSPECVEITKCTTEQTVLVITLSIIYWITVLITVFVMTYFKITVGSLYAIIYYYSVLDILLSQLLYISNGLYVTVNIVSSLAKLTPQFLGQLCLVQNMSGIDQQFIHYVHPTVISLILIMISMLARRSHRVSLFISKGIINFICFLLLLSYTSVATTSLLLMRPLTFMSVNKVYTYLSPDIEYFHGRHLVYVITAAIFMIVIVIALPLLLLLEPILNSKINFIKIKPLLDQFQGCYKDKYRCFAGYYMICRLLIILLVIVKIFDDFTTQYLLLSSCALMALIHLLTRPYANAIHNIIDGIILQLIVIICGLPVFQFVNNYDETFVLIINYFLVILPLMSFIALKLWLNRKTIQNVVKGWGKKCFQKYTTVPTDNVEAPIEVNKIAITRDDNVRKNTIIVNV